MTKRDEPVGSRKKKTASKAELVKRLAEKMDSSSATAEAAYNGMVEILGENIRAGMGTSFLGVGIVTADIKPAKTVRVPTLPEPTLIPERIVCSFEMVRRFAASLRATAEGAAPITSETPSPVDPVSAHKEA